ncbi:MAG: hypothetical protein ABFD69_06700 [Candidatus Sumerlaeia bacterium]
MKRQWLSLILGLVLITGCRTLELDEPIGTPVKHPLEASEFEGKWVLHRGDEKIPFVAKVDDASSGTLGVAWLDVEKKEFFMSTGDVVIRELGGKKIVNLKVYPPANAKNEADRKPEWILFGRIEIRKDQGLIWYPNVDGFEKLIEAGKLPGKTKSNDTVRLNKLSPAQLDLITSNSSTLFMWEEPMRLEKLK